MYDPFKRFREIPDALAWVKEFWSAKQSYEWSKTRSSVGISEATKRMKRAVDELMKLGFFPPDRHDRMPTVSESEGLRHR